MLCIQTEVGKDVLQNAVDEIYKEMNLLLHEAIDEEELLLVKNYLLGSILGDLDGPFSIIQRWRSLILNGLDQQAFNKNINTYKNITAEELQQLAKRYYLAADFFEVQVV
jgi:predicted Zn-dependent peptidase